MIREKDIGTDTSNVFVDTLRFSNLYLNSIGGDKSKRSPKLSLLYGDIELKTC